MTEPPSGFDVLCGGEESNLDIIAIHGIGAHRDKTWKLNGFSWLCDEGMLRDAFPEARIMSYGYASNWLGMESISTSLDAVADRFLRLTHEIRCICPQRRVIFVAHCFGGIVIQKAILQAISNNRPEDQLLVSNIAGIAFLGTPHRGTPSAGLANIVAVIAAVFGYGRSSKILETATTDSQLLAEIVRQFAVKAFHLNLRIHCFYEERETDIAVVTRQLVGSLYKLSKKTKLVDRESACLQGHEETALTLDHFKLNKFSGPEDANYLLVKVDEVILQCLKELYVGDPCVQVDAIEELLGNSLLEQRPSITERPEFQHWRHDGTNRALCIRGGNKATRMTHMVGIERRLTRGSTRGLVAFYHCLSGKRDRVVDLYRSLIWTLVFMFRPLGRYLKEVAVPGKSFEEDIRRNNILPTLLLNMLQDPDIPTVYMVIGDLDELLDGKEELLGIMEKTTLNRRSKVRWAVSYSAHTRPIVQHTDKMITITLDDPTVVLFPSVFKEHAWVNHDMEQAKVVLGVLARQEVGASDSNVRMIPTCDENSTSSSALVVTDAHLDLLASLDDTPGDTLSFDVQGMQLIFDQHLLGLTQLYDATPTEVINLDIVAIPDLDKHPYLSWRDQSWLGQMWLADFLDNDLSSCRVFAYGYASQFTSRGPSAMTHYGEDLLEELKKVRRTPEEVRRPLILVGHGFGAILAAQVLVKAKQYERNVDPMLVDLYRAIKAMILFAVPSRGMLLDTFQAMANGVDTSDLDCNLVEAINEGVQQLTGNLRNFTLLIQGRKIIHLVPNMESPARARSWAFSSRFAEVDSAIVDLPEGIVDTIHVESDEASIARLDTPDNLTYQTILDCLSELESIAIKERGPAWINAATIQQSGISIVHDPPDAIADIILIPSIGGDPWEAWSPSSRSSRRRATLGKFWPAGFLSREQNLPSARILAWGFEPDSSSHVDSLLCGAAKLLGDLTTVRPRGRSIVFVAHSLGGVLLKETLRLANEGDTMDTRDIMSYTATVIFLGTPHRGDGDALTYFDVIRNVITARPVCSTEQVSYPEQTAVRLEACQGSFMQQWKEYDFRVKNFAETPVSGAGGSLAGQSPRYVVPKIAATLTGLDPQTTMMPPSKAGFCRFQMDSERGYRQMVQELSISLSQIQRRELHLRDACLKSLYFSELRNRELDIPPSLDNTGIWLFKHPDYSDWALWDVSKRKKQPGLFWLRGKPGSGKSTLMKNALRLARDNGLKLSFSVAGFFFTHRSNVWLQKSPLGLFMALLHELIQQDIALLIAFIPLFKQKAAAHPGAWTWHQDELQAFFETAYLGQFPGIRNAMVYIDALDESDTEGDKTAYQVSYELVHFFHKITAKDKLKVCLSSRHYPEIQIPNCPQIPTEKFNGNDIAVFVREKLSGIKDDARVRALASKIANKASGVFLWVTLVVGILNMSLHNSATAKDMEEILVSVPGRLEELFKNLFTTRSSPSKAGMRTTLAIFQWILLAERPLEMDELRQALMIDRENLEEIEDPAYWSKSGDCLPDDPEKFLTSLRFYTRGLTEVALRSQEGESTEFVKKRRLEKPITSSKSTILFRKPPSRGELTQGGSRSGARLPPRPQSSGETSLPHSRPSEPRLGYLMLRDNPYCPTMIGDMELYTPQRFDPNRLLQEQSGTEPKITEDSRYEGATTLLSLKRSRRSDLSASRAAGIILASPVQFIHESVREFFSSGQGFSILESPCAPLSLADRHEILAEYCLGCIVQTRPSRTLWYGVSTYKKDPPFLMYAARSLFYHIRQVERSGKFPARVIENLAATQKGFWERWLAHQDWLSFNSRNTHFRTPGYALLHHLCLERLMLSASALLQKEGSVNVQSAVGDSTLHYVARRGDTEVVRFLIDNHADIRLRNNKGESPLHLAVQYRAKSFTVNNLLEPFLADSPCPGVNDVDSKGQTPLHVAVRHGNAAAVKMLLARGALANARTTAGMTPLHFAVEGDHENIVADLLLANADVNVANSRRVSPIHLAVSKTNAFLMHRLVERRAKVNTPDLSGSTPLHLRIMQDLGITYLIANGADIEARTPDRQTALHLAASREHSLENLAALIAAGADQDAVDLSKKTALHYAAEMGTTSAVKLLLQTGNSGPSLSLPDRYGRTPLHYAAQRQSLDVFRLLVEAGADLSVRNMSNVTPVELAGNMIFTDPYLRTLLESRGHKRTLKNINGKLLSVLALP